MYFPAAFLEYFFVNFFFLLVFDCVAGDEPLGHGSTSNTWAIPAIYLLVKQNKTRALGDPTPSPGLHVYQVPGKHVVHIHIYRESTQTPKTKYT